MLIKNLSIMQRFEKRPGSTDIEAIYYIYLMKLLIDQE